MARRPKSKEEWGKTQRADIKDWPEKERIPESKARPFSKEIRDIAEIKEKAAKIHIPEKTPKISGIETLESKRISERFQVPGKTQKTDRTPISERIQISEDKQIPDYYQIPGKTKEARKIQFLEDKQVSDKIQIHAKTPRTGKIHSDYFQVPERSQKSMTIQIPEDKQIFERIRTPEKQPKTWKTKLPGFKRISKFFQKRREVQISEDKEISEEMSEEAPKAEAKQAAEDLSKYFHLSEYGLIPKTRITGFPKDRVRFEDELISIYRPLSDPPIMKYIKQQLKLREPFLDDFLTLPKGLIHPSKAASKTVNAGKNRDKSILPYDHSRIILRPDEISYSDYINASYLDNRKYIITQGSLKETIVDFWRMIWQQECTMIIMFPEYEEKGKIKNIQYWPNVKETVEYGLMKIKAISMDRNAIYEKRTFHIFKKELEKTEGWEINHFTFLKWPERGVPIDPEYILDFRNAVTNIFNKKLPIVVQSSNGVGRSGIYVCIDTLLSMDFKRKTFDPMVTIQGFRDDRAFIIENRSQLEFIYRALAEGIITERFTIKQSEIESQYEGLKKQNNVTRISNFEGQFQDLIRSIKPFTIEECRKSIQSSRDATTTLNILSEDTVFLDGYRMSNELILMKTPKHDMTEEFFDIIFQTQCPVIVAFTNSSQDTLVYLPSKVNSKIIIGKFIVELLTSLDLKDMYVHRVLKLSFKERKNAAELIINHFQAIIWPDKSYPSPDKIASFIAFLNSGQQDQKYQKIAVHGSDGMKKSGLFCVLYNLVNKMSNDTFINIVRLIRLQKKRSPHIVADYKSYQYCWEVANYYYKTFSLYSKY
ncbi:receptor-type tyrosine-protein phosphatase T [Octopus bimaculoides]|uniref:protein-tyrosine-phosphatase n=1 Tax=Octopus bimaculoides TaxID=37653 RepID=A0A0L8HVJ5_OCTBM|nr:receptor-type tyrosine-protein phosphatase T [Octopus bimaculoides]|eukprot:XP_014769029.1 PREDICTED: receptor-type tyrosine-protein phosphatase T-like [Octopus bimaculoides]